MYYPCLTCYQRFGIQYTPECDHVCAYAEAVKKRRTLERLVKQAERDIRKIYDELTEGESESNESR